MNFMTQCFASEMDVKVMEWPLEAGVRADRELSLLADGMGRSGLGCKARKTDFSLLGNLFFFKPWCTALGAPPKGRGGKKAIPSPPHTAGPSAHTWLGAVGWVAR